MKKLVALILTLCLIPCFCFAEIDLSGMSYAELIELNKATINAIMSSKEQYSVVVPVGTYQIGVDIPAGRYTVSIDPYQYSASIKWGEWKGSYISSLYGGYEFLHGNKHNSYPSGEPTSVNVFLTEGHYISVESGSVIFSPYVASFSFQ